MAFHGEGAHVSGGILLAGFQVGRFADEVRVLDPWPRQAGFDRVVLGFEFGTHQAIALFEAPAGAVYPGPDGNHSEFLACRPQHVPQRRTVLHGACDLPAELADVRDSQHGDRHFAERHLTDLAVWEALVGDVI